MSGSWQDFVMTAGAMVFIIALVPMVLGQSKPMVSSSVINALALTGFTVVFVSLGLWYSAITEAIVTLLWVILAAQRQLQKRSELNVLYKDYEGTAS